MNTRLIIICNNKIYGESLASSLNALFGYEEYVLHKESRNLFGKLKEIGIAGSVILIEQGIPGLNYPAFVYDIQLLKPKLQVILGNKLATIIATSTILKLGCDAILSNDIGLKGIVNTLVSHRNNEKPVRSDLEPIKRLSDDDQIFLKDVYYLKPKQLQEKYNVSQQRIWNRKENLFKKLFLNHQDSTVGFRVLGHLYKL